MSLTASEKIKAIIGYLEKVDAFSFKIGEQIQRVVEAHKVKGGNLEFVYVEHFHFEMTGLSQLFQYLLNGGSNKKYVFFATRASIEIILHLEYVLKLAKLDGNEILSLLSKDLAQSATAINEATQNDDKHHIQQTLKDIDFVNKILKTDFDLAKIKSNSKPFPSIRALCNQSQLSLKDSQGSDMYHLYAMYSESNHLRLSNHHSVSSDPEVEVCWALEYFIEIYIKFYELILKTGKFPEDFLLQLNSIKQS